MAQAGAAITAHNASERMRAKGVPLATRLSRIHPFFWITAAAAILFLAFSHDSAAQTMSAATFKARSEAIAAKSRAAQKACQAQDGNARNVCIAQARGDESVALAELKAEYSNVDRTRQEVGAARSQATYRVAREKCEDAEGAARDSCIAKARQAQVASEKGARAPAKKAADKPAVDDDATAAREAAYQATRTRCETYAPEARDRCLKYAR
jgi:hypothetical protein